MEAIKEKFSPKQVLSLLVMGSLMGFLWVLSGLTVKYFIYQKQSNYSVAQVFEWGVIEMDEDNFQVCADFRFHTSGVEEHTSQHLFEETSYASNESAMQAINTLKAKEWKCYWYGDPKNPIASIERLFPYKSLFYSIISMSILVYFSFLKKKYLLLEAEK